MTEDSKLTSLVKKVKNIKQYVLSGTTPRVAQLVTTVFGREIDKDIVRHAGLCGSL